MIARAQRAAFFAARRGRADVSMQEAGARATLALYRPTSPRLADARVAHAPAVSEEKSALAVSVFPAVA